ncbi:MAG: PA0069 family radical SAM protein [Pseudomonadota bacterium]
MSDLLPNQIDAQRRRGRAAASNPANRFDRLHTDQADDGWPREETDPPIRTTITVDGSRSILVRNRSPDVPFDRSINPYRGCEHGCIYCFARPTHAHLGFSPGLDFETKLMVKPNAGELLEKTLRKPGYAPQPIAIGTNTDPYQPIERQYRVMRQILEVLWAYRHPVQITTKGALIARDADLLGRMARLGLASVTISLTTLDNRLSRAMEPRAASPGKRIALIRDLAAHRVPVGVNLAPVIPGLTDHEVERMVEAGAKAGATHAGFINLRLPLEVGPLFRDWLEREYPDRAKRVMERVREMHGGKDYDPQWSKRLRGTGPHAEIITKRFQLAAKRHRLTGSKPQLRIDLFAPPARPGDQLSLGI